MLMADDVNKWAVTVEEVDNVVFKCMKRELMQPVFNTLPKWWSGVKENKTYKHLEVLVPDTEEFNDVLERTVKLCEVTIRDVEITRLEDLRLLTFYRIELASITREKHKTVPEVESRGYHGTSHVAARSIIDRGFSLAYVGQSNGSLCGRGIYLAPQFRQACSHHYCPKSEEDGLCSVLECAFIKGTSWTKGTADMVEPVNELGIRFDCTVDSTYGADQYVIYVPTRILPTYLIRFRPVDEGSAQPPFGTHGITSPEPSSTAVHASISNISNDSF